jgi:hypothetical protein
MSESDPEIEVEVQEGRPDEVGQPKPRKRFEINSVLGTTDIAHICRDPNCVSKDKLRELLKRAQKPEDFRHIIGAILDRMDAW